MPDKTDMRVHRNGLTNLYHPSDGQIVQAHPDKTWTKGVPSRAAAKDKGQNSSSHPVFWPRELLPKIIPQATVHTWGYDADIDNFMQPASRNSVYQHARNLLNDLCDLRDDYEDKTIPFIFIAHSLGGLVVKDALNRSSSELGTRIKDIAPNTFAICFLGTPHRGSKLAKSGRRTIALASLISREPNVKLIQALEQNSEILDRIGDAFLQTLDKYGFQISSFCEEREIRLLLFINMFIVKPDSAKIGHSKEETGTIPADHRNMAKFASESDTGFSRINKTIKRWVDIAVLSRKDEDQDFLKSLKIPEAGLRYQQVVENHKKTFAWLFEKNTVQFIDWLREPKGTGPAERLFWITGKPGSGKSTIMKHAVRNPKTMGHLQASNVSQWHIIPFFFSDRGAENQRVFQTMLQEILYQLLCRITDSFNLILPLYTHLSKIQKTKIPKWDLDTLRQGISEVISKSTSKAGVCLFMDALDEHSGDNENLCKFFWDLSRKSGGSIVLKICLASRPWPVFQKHFQGCRGFAIHDHTKNDIWNYVTSRLYEASDNPESRLTATEGKTQGETGKSELAHDVTRNAQGVFIWVRLVIDELCQGLTDGTPIVMLREVLKNIPYELEDLYARALSKVKSVYAAEAHIMLHMVLSSLSPLPIEILLSCATYLLVGSVDHQKPEAQTSRLASRTGGLLEVVNSNGSSIVQFIHQTAKEYIRSHGNCLTLEYRDRIHLQDLKNPGMFEKPSPHWLIARDEFRNMEGPEFLFLCGARNPSLSASIAPHLFTYAKEVDNKLPKLDRNKSRLVRNSFSRLLDNANLWQSSSVYNILESFTAGPSRVELAVAANWKNMIRHYYSNEKDFTKTMHLAALGPSVLDDSTDRVGMIEALIDGNRKNWPILKINDLFGLREKRTTSASWTIERSDQMRMLNSVGADSHTIISETTLLTTLISIKSHPFVSEPEIIEIGALLLKSDEKASILGWSKVVMHLDGQNIDFPSPLSFCLHIESSGWVDMFLQNTKHENLAHCLASGRGFAHSDLRATLLQESFGRVKKELRPIPDDDDDDDDDYDDYEDEEKEKEEKEEEEEGGGEDEGLSGVGWPLIWFGSQCGIVGFPHINRGFCSSGDHRRAGCDDCMEL